MACEVLHVARSAYHKWAYGKQSRRAVENERLADKLEKLHEESPDKGYRRLNDDLRHDYGIYVNEPGLDTAPRMLSIDNNDNDIISTTYIGKRAGTADRYLYATQNNSFIIVELGSLNEDNRYTTYSVSAYSPLTHGQLAEYL